MSQINNWNDFEKNNKTIAVNIIYIPNHTEDKGHAYKLKHNLSRKNLLIILMIATDKKLHHLAVNVCLYRLEE